MTAKPRAAPWFASPTIIPEARALLALVDPPEQPLEFQAFVAGVRDALGALSPEHEILFLGRPLGAILNQLSASVPSEVRAVRTQWDQDPLRGHGATAYRAFAQPAPPGSPGGYACLKAILLGLLLVRSRGRKAVSLEAIEHVVRFTRLASQDVHVDHEFARAAIIASLPSTFIPSKVRAALAQCESVPPALHPRLKEIVHAVEMLARSFSLLDRGDPIPTPSIEATTAGTSSSPPKPPAPTTRPARTRHRPPPRHSPDLTSAGVEDPETTFIYGAAFTPSADVMEEIAHAAEAIDDRLPLSEALIQETSSSTSAVKRRMTALRLMSDVRQGFWARCQWDASSPGEMRNALQRLREELARLEVAPDATRHEALTLGLLSASTGLPRTRCHSIRAESLVDRDEKSAPDILDRDRGSLTLPLVAREERYKPKPEQVRFLREVKDAVPIQLAQEVTAELRRLIPSDDGYAFRTELDVLEKILDTLFQDARDGEPRITAARLFRGHQLEVLNQCGDPTVAQMLTGQTLGTPPVGLSYYAAKPKILQAIYNRAVASHGLTPSEGEDSSYLVGSKLALTDEAFASVVESTSQGLVNRPRDRRTQGRELLYLQDALVRATAMMWMAGTGFRPTFRLGEIRACHINWMSNTAVIADKLTDAAHEGRLVPLAPTLTQSLGAYGAVLGLMAKADELNASVRQAARHALTGSGPLFFILGKDGKAIPIDAHHLSGRLPEGWNLPENFLRHRIATRLREVDCPGLYVQALMGHIEQGIQPFGSESFMVPSEYLSTTSEKVEKALEEDGWRPLLGGFGDPQIFLDHAPPVDDSVLHVERVSETAAQEAFKRQRQHVEALRESLGDEIQAQVLARVGQARPDLINAPNQAHELDSAAVTALRMAVTEGADSAALAELRVRALRDYLIQRREIHGWKVKRLPQFFTFPPTPSVHYPTFVPAHLALERLRAHFVADLSRDPGKSAPTAADAKLRIVLALILWQGVSSWDRLARILAGLGEAEPISDHGEGIAVPVSLKRLANDPTPEASAEVLTGAVALAAISARPHLQSVDRKEIDELVAAWVPPACVKAPKGQILNVLFAIARIGHRFESPPPLRLVWSEQILSVPMPLDRLRALFGQPAASVGTASTPTPTADVTAPQRDSSLGTIESATAYKWLKATLRGAKDATRPFPADALAPPSAESTDSANARTKAVAQTRSGHRTEAMRRLEARLRQWPQDGSLVRALTAYALDRLENGTPWSPRIEPSVVYKYALGAGTPLFKRDPDMHLSDLEEEDFSELYASCITGAKESYREELTAFLAYFHGYLVQQGLAPRVSIGRSGDKVVSFPEVGYVAPNEIAASVALLESELAAAEKLDTSLTEIRASMAAIALGAAAGARTAETLLRESRELVTDQGRRALLVRKNRWVSTKTHRGTRLVDLEPTMPTPGWSAIDSWRTLSASVRTSKEVERSALFSDTVDGRTPLPSEQLTRRIAATLRHSTKRRDARFYWWRHTSVSNDALSLFGTPEMLAAVRRGTNAAGLPWLPDPLRMRRSLGGDLPLGQAHAAGFRSRRGHADMQTPFSTYAHTTGLIEHWACRKVSEKLSSTALANLAGLRPAALRQRMSRGEVSVAPSSRPGIRFLIQQGAPSRSDTRLDEAPAPEPPPVAPRNALDPEQFCEALFRSLRGGNLQPLVDSLHLSVAAAQRLTRRIGDALGMNVFGLNLGIDLPVKDSPSMGVPRSRSKPSTPLSFERVDQAWLRRCLTIRCEHPELSSLWSIVLRGLDPRSGQIAARSDQEFIALLNQLPQATGQTGESPYRVAVIVDASVRRSDHENIQGIIAGTASKGCPMHEEAFRVPKGWALTGVAVESATTGRRLIAGIAFLALASELLLSGSSAVR
jgi:hypothetical protein